MRITKIGILCVLLLPIMTLYAENENQLISLDFKNAELVNVLRVFSDQYHVNIVASEDVKGMVTVRLVDVPLEESLRAILNSHGYGYVVEENIYRVALLSQLTQEQQARQQLAEYEDLVTEVIQLRYLDAQDVKKVINGMLSGRGKIEVLERRTVPGWELGGFGSSSSGGASSSSGGSGSVAQSGLVSQRSANQNQYEKSRTIIISDLSDYVKDIKRVIERMDHMPEQVMIDTIIVELTVDDAFNFGVRWDGLEELTLGAVPSGMITDSFTRTNDLDNSAVFSNTQNDVLTRTTPALGPSTSTRVETNTLNGVASTLASTMKDSVFSDLRTVVLSSSQLNVVLSALASDEDVDVISNPKLLTLDNHEATILVGENFPIFTTTVSDQGTVTESFDYYQPVGISLRVIPQITADNNINMLIHPSVSEIDSFVTGTTGLRYPRISVREADTQVLVRENQTIVIGGLMSDREEETVSRVPILGDIPLLGLAFRHKSTSKKKINLLVFVTPRIVRPDEMTEQENLIYKKFQESRNIDQERNKPRRRGKRIARERRINRQEKHGLIE